MPVNVLTKIWCVLVIALFPKFSAALDGIPFFVVFVVFIHLFTREDGFGIGLGVVRITESVGALAVVSSPSTISFVSPAFFNS